MTHQITASALALSSSAGMMIASIWTDILSAEKLSGEQIFILTIASSIFGSLASMVFLSPESKTMRQWMAKVMGSISISVILGPFIIYKIGWDANAYVVFFVSGMIALLAKFIIRAMAPAAGAATKALTAWALRRLGVEMRDDREPRDDA